MSTWRKPSNKKPNFDLQEIPEFKATKFFDQLSFIGNEIVGCFVLEIEDGYVLIDCMNPDELSKNTIEKGFKDLGFDITKLKAIIISHGHGDHYGMCDYFKDTYGCDIYMSKIDYEFASHMPDYFPWKPIEFKVDHFLEDGEVLPLGNIECCFTPGHCVGCFSFIIPVTDEGTPHQAALWGGSGILPDTSIEDYENSWYKFSKLCKERKVDVEISTHPALDNGLERLKVVQNIVDGVPNPFVIGIEGYQYYEKKFLNLVQSFKNKQ